ncbi:TonB-dependent receptor [Halopseudomonas pachastrellae]|nr:TonB-dependent receptor [Halopseudomonas pachastrellae]
MISKPTEGEQFELGVKYQPPGTSTLLTASLYHLVQSNSLTRDLTDSTGSFSTQSGEETSQGLELEAVSDLTNDLRMLASYSYNRAEVTESNDGDEGNTPILTPEHLASLWLDYTLPSGMLQGLGVSGGVRYSGSSYADAANTSKNEAYTLVDLGAHYDLRGSLDGIRLAVNAKNSPTKSICPVRGATAIGAPAAR